MLASIIELLVALVGLAVAGRILIGLLDAQRSPRGRKKSR
jgi:hypothetical protein